MKNLIVLFISMFSVICSQAQVRAIDLVFEKYAGKEGFTTVEVSEKLFSLCASAIVNEDPEIQKIISGMKGVRIITFENTEENVLSKSMYKEFEAAIPAEFEELLRVNSEGEKVRFMVKMKSDKVIEELILLVDDVEEFVMIDIIGIIDIEQLSKLKDLNIDGLENLDIQIESK